MKNKEVTIKLINEAINETIATHANSAATLYTCSWGWRLYDESTDTYVVGPNNESCFHCANRVIKILEGTGVHWFLAIENNAMGEPAACIHFF